MIGYKPLTTAEQIFKDLIWTPAITLGEMTLEGYLPFLSIPGLNLVERGILNQFSDWLFSQFVLFVDVTAIQLVNQAHQNAYDEKSIKLKVIAHDYGIESEEFNKARDEARIALSHFTQFGG